MQRKLTDWEVRQLQRVLNEAGKMLHLLPKEHPFALAVACAQEAQDVAMAAEGLKVAPRVLAGRLLHAKQCVVCEGAEVLAVVQRPTGRETVTCGDCDGQGAVMEEGCSCAECQALHDAMEAGRPYVVEVANHG